MEFVYFWHDHPLNLNIDHRDYIGDHPLSCYACEQPISGSGSGSSSSSMWFPFYSCKGCWFFVHKLCAEMPTEMTHPSHPQHPLSLQSSKPSITCDVCGDKCNRLRYHCSQSCNFDIHIKCATTAVSIQQSIKHKSHEHPLIPLEKPATFLCDACGTQHAAAGTSYLCTTCGFWINQNCANSLPLTITLKNHTHHPLHINYTIPSKYLEHRSCCGLCSDRVLTNWIYSCADHGCAYYVHLKCAQSAEKLSIECETDTAHRESSNISIAKIERFPDDVICLPDESSDLMTQFIKNLRIKGKYEEEATEIMHVSHEHPLFLSDHNKMDRESCSTTDFPLLLLNDLKKIDHKCNGCSQSITASPFFYCDRCKFFLHKWCAELPDQLRHPGHPGDHPLLLETDFHMRRCDCCELICNTHNFRCSSCNFDLDSKCASLPRIMRHEAHEHFLALRPRSIGNCIACGNRFWRLAFECEVCKFNICPRCALLPRTVRHRYDEHPFILTYSTTNNEDFCEICLENIAPNYWFYHCHKCDQSLHVKCILPIGQFANIYTGNSIPIDDHPHRVTFAPNKKVFSCGLCGSILDRTRDNIFAFECAACNIFVCSRCAWQRQ